MGLSNVPATFQRASHQQQHNIFVGLINNGVMIFIDHILVYSKTCKYHLALHRHVFRHMKQNKQPSSQKKSQSAASHRR